MEPRKQIEVQLGHLCNNRCVFCVSGQETALGRARPVDVGPVLVEIERAFADGHRKLTLLGGEPTLQPGFLTVVRRAVALGFEEIVVFTNGARTARAELIDEILATGGHFSWRISIQGATRASHEATTKKLGSFERILRTMRHLRDRGERISVNMCVVSSNWADVAEFPALLVPFGVEQLHLDMMRPLDAGQRTEAELRAMIPRYSEIVAPLEAMVAQFPAGFDVNIGNLPFCIAPKLSPWIHHDGEPTSTIAADGDNRHSRPWDKYLVKRRDKVKLESCATCAFDSRCSGIFETYRKFHGTSELIPMTPERLRAVDREGRWLALSLAPVMAGLSEMDLPLGFEAVVVSTPNDGEVLVELRGPESLVLSLSAKGGGVADYEGFSVHVLKLPSAGGAARSGLAAVGRILREQAVRAIRPLGGDAAGGLARSVAVRLARLRNGAPYGELGWVAVDVGASGQRAEASFVGPDGERASVWLGEHEGRAVGGYELGGHAPTAALVEGLRAIMGALNPHRGAGTPIADRSP
jgi:MoaA/NifB/PqqE/SkfB family radical SAM enzyme